jgi:anti-anti-sigma factor
MDTVVHGQLTLTVCAQAVGDGVLAIAAAGEADLSTASGFQQWLIDLLDDPGWDVLALDMSGLRVCDCASLGVLLRARRAVRRDHRRMVISAAAGGPEWILVTTGVHALFEYRPVGEAG